ncbi:hypothetical protein BKA62DRAFT_697919, partial [Auriculariales sp. MPI-PUGE-AT-0066]
MRSVNDNLVQFRLDFKNFRTDFDTQQTLSPGEDTRRSHVTLMSISDDVRIVRALIEGTSNTLTPAPSRDERAVRIHNDSEHVQINISLPALRATGSALLCAVTRGMTPANGMAITMVMALASRDTKAVHSSPFLLACSGSYTNTGWWHDFYNQMSLTSSSSSISLTTDILY